MVEFYSNVLIGDAVVDVKTSTFWDSESVLFNQHYQRPSEQLSALTFKVSRKPKDLMAHWQRIYFCYQQAMSEPLYAALLDLLIILDNKGQTFSQRLIQGSRSQLNSDQLSTLKQAASKLWAATGNRYSLFTIGIIGKPELLFVTQFEQEQHDYLALAEDFIEYSQLEEAMSILEVGLSIQPARKDLQALLLEIYQTSHNYERFKGQYERIKSTGVPLIEAWPLLVDFFESKTS